MSTIEFWRCQKCLNNSDKIIFDRAFVNKKQLSILTLIRGRISWCVFAQKFDIKIFILKSQLIYLNVRITQRNHSKQIKLESIFPRS